MKWGTMRTIVGAGLGIIAGTIFYLVVWSTLKTEPCFPVSTLQCHVFGDQQYVSIQDFANSPPAVIGWVAGAIIGGVIGHFSG